MGATRNNIFLYQGDDWAGLVSVTDAEGDPADLTGYTARSHIRHNVADKDSTIDVNVSATIQGSQVILSIPAADSESLSGNYVWDLELVSGDGIVTTIIYGRVFVTAEVTRVSA